MSHRRDPAAGRRRAPRRRRSGRVRAVLSLGIVLGFGTVSTLASWTDTATLNSGTIQSGRLDLLLAGNLAEQGGAFTQPDLHLAAMIPGESVAVTVPVQRAAGSVGFTYTATATATGALAPHLRWTVTAGSAGTPATSSGGTRTNTCSGTALSTDQTLTSTSTAVIASPRSLAGATMSENICIRVELPATAGNDAQNASASGTFVLAATQVS